VIRTPASLKTVGAAPSPDGRYIWYAGRTGDWQYNAVFPQYQLYRYDRENGNSTRMTGRYGSAFRPAISPDGLWLVYGTREDTETGLRIRDLSNGEERWLAYPVQRDEMESRAPLDVRYGDGKHNRLFREKFAIHRLLLMAVSLSFQHPYSGERLTLHAGLPSEVEELFRELNLFGDWVI